MSSHITDIMDKVYYNVFYIGILLTIFYTIQFIGGEIVLFIVLFVITLAYAGMSIEIIYKYRSKKTVSYDEYVYVLRMTILAYIAIWVFWFDHFGFTAVNYILIVSVLDVIDPIDDSIESTNLWKRK